MTMATSHVFLLMLAVCMAMPFVWMMLASFKPKAEIEQTHWAPKQWRPGNYPQVFRKLYYGSLDPAKTARARGEPSPTHRWTVWDYLTKSAFVRYYFNSLFVAAWVTLGQCLTSAMAAFAFSRLRWRGRDKVFLLYLGTMMIPGLVLMIPNYQIMMRLGWVDTYAGLIIPAAFSAFGTFLLRQFMLTIPTSLDEAAMIDGAGKWQVFWEVILPLARPGLIVLCIFTFLGTYKSFFWPLVMLRTQHKYTLQVGLLFFDNSQTKETHLILAAAAMTIIPLIVLFVILQKYLVRGIRLGAVKG
jgi:ABC-type glycerol-3-phosphate transport system permease component